MECLARPRTNGKSSTFKQQFFNNQARISINSLTNSVTGTWGLDVISAMNVSETQRHADMETTGWRPILLGRMGHINHKKLLVQLQLYIKQTTGI